MSAVLDWVQVVTEFNFRSPLFSNHNAEAHSVTIATVTLCDHSEQVTLPTLFSFPQPL